MKPLSRTPLAFLVLILALLFALKLLYPAGPGPYGADANYFYQIARHVAEGDGLRTSVSIYHEGIQRLPGPTRVYPLWPMLLGLCGRIIGLQPATQVLPILLYVIDLCLLYFLTIRVAGRLGFSAELRSGSFNGGHLAVLVFGLNRLFFTATAHPYTEGLAFGLAFGGLLALDRAESSGRYPAFGIAGLLCGLAFLARSQMAVLAGVVLLVLLWRALRLRSVAAVFAYGAGLAIALLPWYLYLAMNYPLAALNPFAGINPFFDYRETPEVPSFVAWVPVDGTVGWLRDRLPGALVAINPRNPMSYFASFGVVVALIPVAIVRARRLWHRTLPAVDATLSALTASGALFQVSLLHFHATFFLPWLFGWRHGLPLILLLIPAILIVWYDSLPLIRTLAAVLIGISLVTSLIQLSQMISAPRLRPTAGQLELVSWVQGFTEPPTIVTPSASALAMLGPGKYHWTLCTEPPEQTMTMLRHLPIDFVAASEQELRCPFIRPLLDSELEVVRVFGDEGGRMILLRPLRSRDRPAGGI